jgi:hypothetical protein
MEPKTPVMLVVLVETARLRWFVASIDPDGATTPLLRSEEGDLDAYRAAEFDEQVSFLRHRFCGVLQRGCDRLWARGRKAARFVLVFEGSFAEEKGDLRTAVADHFVQWMLNPPVSVFTTDPPAEGAQPRLDPVAGDRDGPAEALLRDRLGDLLAARADPDAWELSPKKGA